MCRTCRTVYLCCLGSKKDGGQRVDYRKNDSPDPQLLTYVYRDVICELASYGNVPMTASSAETSRKRTRDDARLDIPSPTNYQSQFPTGPRGAPHHIPSGSDTFEVSQNPTSWEEGLGADGNQSIPGAVVPLDNTISEDDWWNYRAGDAPIPPQLPLYGDPSTPYVPQTHGDTQWPIMTPADEDSMDFSDVAMLWLQQPQSAWTWEDTQGTWTG